MSFGAAALDALVTSMMTDASRTTGWFSLALWALLVFIGLEMASSRLRAVVPPALSGSAGTLESELSATLASRARYEPTESALRRPDDESMDDSLRWVEGTVVLPAGHDRVAPAWIVARGAPRILGDDRTRDFRALANDEGSFRVAFAPETKRGELLIESPTLVLASHHWVVLGAEPPEVVLRPSLGGVIRCRVEPAAGSSLPPDLFVSLFRPRGTGRALRNRFVPVGDGVFEARQLLPGTDYELEVTGSGALSVHRAGLSVAGGKTTGVSVRLCAGLQLSLVVTDDRGAPVEAFEVEATPLPSLALAVTRPQTLRAQDAAGCARVTGLVAGTWSIRVAAAGHVTTVREMLVAASTPSANVTLHRAGLLVGKVVDPEGKPCEHAWVTTESSASSSSSRVESDDERPHCRVRAEGRFVLADVPPGSVRVFALANEHAPSTPELVVLGAGERVGPVELRLRRYGSIVGRVEEAVGVQSFDVHELASDRRWSAQTDGEGRFLVDRLVPGEFELSVVRKSTPSEKSASATSTRTLSRRVSVMEGRATEVEW